MQTCVVSCWNGTYGVGSRGLGGDGDIGCGNSGERMVYIVVVTTVVEMVKVVMVVYDG